MEDISQIILDLAQNSLAAAARKVKIHMKRNHKNNLLEITMIDDGAGMDRFQVSNCTNPFYTTRTTREVGLGLSLTQMLCEQSNGYFKVSSRKGYGTVLRFAFDVEHWDRPPIGKLEDTYITLIVLNPHCEIILTLKFGNESFTINSKEIKETIGDSNLSDGWVVNWIREYLTENIYHLVEEELL